MAIIVVGTAASGLDIFLKQNGILTDPASISYSIKEPAGSTVGSAAGFKRSIGHYDARNTVIPSGFNLNLPWQIIWSFTSANGIVGGATEEFTVVSSLASSFIELDDIIEQIKLDLGLSDTKFSDVQYKTFIVKGLNKINRELCLANGPNELQFDDSTGLITPTLNSAGIDLVVLSVECLIVKRERRVAIGKGIRVRSGDQEIDTTAGFTGHKDLMDSVCGNFDKAIANLKYSGCSIFVGGSSTVTGELIWYGNQRIEETMEHDGQGTGLERDFSSPFDTSFGETDTGFCRR